MVTEEHYASAIPPSRKSGDTRSVPQGKERLLHLLQRSIRAAEKQSLGQVSATRARSTCKTIQLRLLGKQSKQAFNSSDRGSQRLLQAEGFNQVIFGKSF